MYTLQSDDEPQKNTYHKTSMTNIMKMFIMITMMLIYKRLMKYINSNEVIMKIKLVANPTRYITYQYFTSISDSSQVEQGPSSESNCSESHSEQVDSSL